MGNESLCCDVSPKVVPADARATITIRPLEGLARFDDTTGYEVTYFPMEEFSQKSGWPERNRPAFRLVNGALQITQFFEAEQEHVLLVEAVAGDKRTPVGSFHVYSLSPDLYTRRPFKGDFHIHSCRSDGLDPPAHVAAACRRIGMDFMAVTDHCQYAPSLEAQQAFAGAPIDLAIYPGEEVHPAGAPIDLVIYPGEGVHPPDDHPVHMVNFGGAWSVNELFADTPAYSDAVRQLEQNLPHLPAGVDRYQYASCLWVFDKIRQGGGLAVFCHPYWFDENRYTPSGAITSLLLERQPFDALEVIGGYRRHEVVSNALQVARYHEQRSRGQRIPIVGASDTHSCEGGELFGWYYTIVFAPSTRLPDLIESVKGLYSVAIEALPGEHPRAHGPFRLVKYALFLMRDVFPDHDDLCQEEGQLMLAYLAGDTSAGGALKALQGRTSALQDRLWGQAPR